MSTTTPRLLLIDNYDSFTYNLVQAFMVLGADVLVHRNDQITVEEARKLQPSHLCISPGPGTPYDAGVSMKMIEAFLKLFHLCQPDSGLQVGVFEIETEDWVQIVAPGAAVTPSLILQFPQAEIELV